MKSIKKVSYEVYESENAVITIKKDGKNFFSVPASASVNGEFSNMSLASFDEKQIIYSANNEKMIFTLFDDCITVSYEKSYKDETAIYISKLFASQNMGMELVNFDRAFTTQPRNNKGKNLDYYHHLPDISNNGYYTPTILQISLGSPNGWVSIGMLDIPDTKIAKMDDDFSFLVESLGGNKIIPAGGTYKAPELIIMFANDEWDAISIFRKKLIDFGKYTPKKPKFSEVPIWWKNPFVCTYGDQMLENIVGYDIDEKWVLDIVERAESEWGIEKFNLVIDDSWQHPLVHIVDDKRFPDFRGFIDSLHQKGHHVILWHAFPFERRGYDFETLGEKYGVLSDQLYTNYPFLDNTYYVDFTHDNTREYLRNIAELLFGDKEGQYNADGIKMDFLSLFRDPATSKYQHPERGMGFKEALRCFEIFYEEAKRVKPDVLIDSSAVDPRFEHTLDFNRLHDTHVGNIEKDIRAKISTLACPDLIIDSDGALMLNRWLKNNYINAALYGVPFNYYTKRYHDAIVHDEPNWSAIEGVPEERQLLLTEEKQKLANLFKMTVHRPDGTATVDEYGNWTLTDNGVVNAITQKGDTIIYYPTDKSDTGYIYTFRDEPVEIPLYGRKIADITPAPDEGRVIVDYARDRAFVKLKVGIVHTFKNRDEGNSTENLFKKGSLRAEVEAEMNYVNG